MAIRGIRGATTCNEDADSMLAATKELILKLLSTNPTLQSQDIASAIFTVTPDLQAVYPARAARDLGWTEVPLMCALEINVPGALRHCIRVLIHWNTNLPQSAVHHVYLHEAIQLRPDLVHEA